MSAIDTVYEKYKHLDGCLSDPEWCNAGTSAQLVLAGELWRAVKEVRETPCEENGCTDIENCDEICQHSRIYSPVQVQQAIAQATKKAREDFANQLKTNVGCMREMKDFAQCGGCPYRKCKDNGYYDCDIDKVLRIAQPEPKEREPPKCTQNHHNDDGSLIVYGGAGKPCGTCDNRIPCFERFLKWRDGRRK